MKNKLHITLIICGAIFVVLVIIFYRIQIAQNDASKALKLVLPLYNAVNTNSKVSANNTHLIKVLASNAEENSSLPETWDYIPMCKTGTNSWSPCKSK